MFRAEIIHEPDGSVTAAAVDMDLAENAGTEDAALQALAESILDYAREYHAERELYERDTARRRHRPYIDEALKLGDPDKIREMIKTG